MAGYSMLVACDLIQARETYKELFAELKDLDATRIQESIWTLDYDGRCDELRDNLVKFLGPRDRLLVAITRDLAWWNQITEKPEP